MSSKVRSFKGCFQLLGAVGCCICTEFDIFCMGRTLFEFKSGLFFIGFI